MNQIINSYCINLLRGLFLISLIIGGDSLLYAQLNNQENIYRLIIENNRSKIISNIEIYARNIDEAKNITELNGWSVIDIKLISNMAKQNDPTTIVSKDSSGSNLPNKIVIRSPFDNRTNAYLIKDNLTTSTKLTDNVTDNISSDAKDKLAETENLTPLNKNLTLMSTLYYDLGMVFTNNLFEGEELSALDPTKRYVIFGFADDVRVMPNSEYKNNFQLSYKRAEEIYNRLVRRGLPSKLLQYFGLGTRYPKVTSDNVTSDIIGIPENRRVEIYEYR